MKKGVFILLFIFHLFTVAAQQSVVKLSLQDAIHRFSENNLNLIAERYNIDIAEAEVIQARLFENRLSKMFTTV